MHATAYGDFPALAMVKKDWPTRQSLRNQGGVDHLQTAGHGDSLGQGVMSMDTLSPKQRSARMALIRGKDTKLEMAVRRLVHGLGYRYRLHGRDLPGTPDMVFRSRGKVIFVHGCFWHGHDCNLGRMPKSRISFWSQKIQGNRERDKRVLSELSRLGWKSLVIWECETRDLKRIEQRIRSFLDDA